MRGTDPAYAIISRTLGPFTTQHGQLLLLMYHRIQDTPRSPGYVPVASFVEHLDILLAEGYRGVTLEGALKDWPRVMSEGKTVVLTFDDLWASQVDVCLPAMKDRGFAGTFFVATGYISDFRYRPESGPLGLFDSEMSCWRDMEKLLEAGMEVGAHTHTHRMLSTLSDSDLEEEFGESNRILTRRVGTAPKSFAFPFGKAASFDARSTQMLPKFGYRAACTTHWGRPQSDSNLFLLPRMDVNGRDGAQRFRRKVSGHYDFLRWISK